ncbi:MAG: hypothetical protein ACE5KJ_06305 [Candidatus Zixiibacteriota bacterium]
MHFIFGYQREVSVKIKREASKFTLLGLALLIILLLILLSFENLDKDTIVPPSIFEKSPSLDKPNEATQAEELKFEKNRIPPEENEEMIFVSNQGGLE